MGRSFPAARPLFSLGQYRRHEPASELPALSHLDPEPTPELTRHPASRVLDYRAQLPAGQHSSATAHPSPSSPHGLPNPLHDGRSPVLSLNGHNMPRCRTGPRAADLQLLAFLLPKPTAAPSESSRLARNLGST